jgi:hypothetical protein
VDLVHGTIDLVDDFSFRKKIQKSIENPGAPVLLQKTPYSLVYLCFSPYNFRKTTTNFSEIIFVPL